MLGNEGDFVAIDSFRPDGGSRELLERNLERHGAGRCTILQGDAFEFLPRLDRRVGAYYYDAAHDRQSQLEALRLVGPHLVPGALTIVDDTEWERVASAMDEYLSEQPRARRLVRIDGRDRGQPWWWYGLQVLVRDGD